MKTIVYMDEVKPMANNAKAKDAVGGKKAAASGVTKTTKVYLDSNSFGCLSSIIYF